MQKIRITFLCILFVIISGQDWKMENNPFNQMNSRSDGISNSWKKNEINHEKKNACKIINSSSINDNYFEL